MKKSRIEKVPVAERALFARINRVLQKQDEMLRRSREGSRLEQSVGRYYTIDVGLNAIARHFIDLEKYGRELGVLADYEVLSEGR